MKIIYLVAAVVAIAILMFVFFPFQTSEQTVQLENKSLEQKEISFAVKAQFDYINANMNSACYGMSTVMQMQDNDTIRGSCCGPMFLHTYTEQREALKKYSNIEQIPKDPYNISVNQAKELINYFKTIQLNEAQQKIYEDAKGMADDKGPCCCGDDFSETSCWRWKVYGGLAKFLITTYNYDAQQIAEVWNFSDGCGGDKHVHT